jgi:hypothetical protein
MPAPSEYPPYVNAYNGIPKLFAKIKEAAVPPKFTVDFVSTALGFKSSSFRAMIPLLKRLGFIDQNNVPTQAYRDYRDDSQSGAVMAAQLREAYRQLFAANEYAYRLEKKDLQTRLRSLLGAAESDVIVGYVASTFTELSKLAEWDASPPIRPREEVPYREEELALPLSRREALPARLGLSYTINLNLPATTEIEVFNAIFKSLRDNLLRES